MSEKIRSTGLEDEIRKIYASPQTSQRFIHELQIKLENQGDAEYGRKFRPFYLRPVWTVTSAVLLLLIAAFFIIGPQRVYAEVRKLLGYLPGVGIVDTSEPIRVLAEPVEQTKDGVRITVTSAVLTADKTHIEYRVFGVTREAYPSSEDIFGCMQQEYLRLPDGTTLQRLNEYPPVPSNVNEAVLVIPCIANTLPGKAPENWEIPLMFIPAPADLTAMPVEELTQTGTSEVNETQEPTTSPSVVVDKVVETGGGYILIGRFEPQTADGEWVRLSQMARITDTLGKDVSYSIPTDIADIEGLLPSGGFGWAYEFNASGVTFPVQITFEGVKIRIPDPDAQAEFTFNPGDNPQPGQEWQLDQKINLAGHELKVISVFSSFENGYGFTFLGDKAVNGVSVTIKGYTPIGGGGGGGVFNGRFTVSQTYSDLPRGELKVILSNLSEVSEPQNWTGTWSPTTPRSDLAGTQVVPEGTCIAAGSLSEIPELPETISGKALFYEQHLDTGLWGMVLYNLNGAGRTNIGASGNWGALSPDGQKVVFAGESGFQVYESQSGSITPLNIDGYNPRWSPDGMKIAYIGGAAAGVYVVDISSGTSSQVSSQGFETVIGWSADGSALDIAVPFSGGSAWQVRTVDPNSGTFTDLFIIEDGSRKALNAAISPDGQWISYRGMDNSTVHLVRIDGSGNRVLMENPGVGTSGLVWASNGWLGVSLIQSGTDKQDIILVNPATCEKYHASHLSGTLQGLIIE